MSAVFGGGSRRRGAAGSLSRLALSYPYPPFVGGVVRRHCWHVSALGGVEAAGRLSELASRLWKLMMKRPVSYLRASCCWQPATEGAGRLRRGGCSWLPLTRWPVSLYWPDRFRAQLNGGIEGTKFPGCPAPHPQPKHRPPCRRPTFPLACQQPEGSFVVGRPCGGLSLR